MTIDNLIETITNYIIKVSKERVLAEYKYFFAIKNI